MSREYLVARDAQSPNFKGRLGRVNKVMGYIGATGSDQHRTSYGDATGNRLAVNRKGQLGAPTVGRFA